MTWDDDARLGEDPTRRAVPRGLATAVAVALVVVAVASIELRFGEAPPARPVSSNPVVGSGALVYLARDDVRARLWVVDLLAGVARPGPAVPRGTAELVDVSGAGSGWVGVERRVDHRIVAASILRGVAPNADVVGSAAATWSRGGRAGGASCSLATGGRLGPDARRSASAW